MGLVSGRKAFNNQSFDHPKTHSRVVLNLGFTIIQPDPVMPTVTALHPSAELIAFAERQVRHGEQSAISEKRFANRNPLVVSVIAQPIDEQCKPVRPPIAMVTRDITSQGVGLLSERELDERLIALYLPLGDQCVYLGCEVLWCRIAGPFYSIGAQFVFKLDEFPQWKGEVRNTSIASTGEVAPTDAGGILSARDTKSADSAKTTSFDANRRRTT